MKTESCSPENMYSIGEIAKMANVSTKTMRHYEKIGLIKPDYIKENGYRYYHLDARLKIPIIKYLQFMNFTLDEIRHFLNGENFCDISQDFEKMIENTKREIKELNDRIKIISDWNKLINEGCSTALLRNDNIRVKFLESQEFIKYDIDFDYDYMHAILDVDFANFIKKQKNKITGAVMVYFQSIRERIENELEDKVTSGLYIQKTVDDIQNKDDIFYFKGGCYAAIYHFGDHKNLKESYDKIFEWAKREKYELEDTSIERFVVDYWTTIKSEQFVTEILIPIKNNLLKKGNE